MATVATIRGPTHVLIVPFPSEATIRLLDLTPHRLHRCLHPGLIPSPLTWVFAASSSLLSGAFALSATYYLWREKPMRNNLHDDFELLCFHKLPGSSTYPWWQVSPLYRSYVDGDAESEHLRDGFLCNIQSWGLIVNTFSLSLERNHLDFLRNYLGHGRVWEVGALTYAASHDRSAKWSSSISADDIVSWLHGHEDRQVCTCASAVKLF
ncbi:UDP-glycosyltransferase 89B2-like [Prosopis cineraria]|uniref:UDP-glycosyltransferase 89B2-like n=1 Tax=Prosopis cineraria TaxID=364024 RepID=UPI00240F6EC2|nr:UDP-glycosyltransferase 89B2-like [Prosopis cineraria]